MAGTGDPILPLRSVSFSGPSLSAPAEEVAKVKALMRLAFPTPFTEDVPPGIDTLPTLYGPRGTPLPKPLPVEQDWLPGMPMGEKLNYKAPMAPEPAAQAISQGQKELAAFKSWLSRQGQDIKKLNSQKRYWAFEDALRAGDPDALRDMAEASGLRSAALKAKAALGEEKTLSMGGKATLKGVPPEAQFGYVPPAQKGPVVQALPRGSYWRPAMQDIDIKKLARAALMRRVGGVGKTALKQAATIGGGALTGIVAALVDAAEHPINQPMPWSPEPFYNDDEKLAEWGMRRQGEQPLVALGEPRLGEPRFGEVQAFDFSDPALAAGRLSPEELEAVSQSLGARARKKTPGRR